MADLGFRTPIIFRWPGKIAAGRRLEDVVSTVDLFPTMLDAAHVERPPGPSGVDLMPLLREQTAAGPGRAFGSMRHLRDPNDLQKTKAWRKLFVRTDEWRYVFDPQLRKGALYRISVDPAETTDLAAQHPEVASDLRARLSEWQRSNRVRTARAGKGGSTDGK